MIWTYKVPHHKPSLLLAEEEHLTHGFKTSRVKSTSPLQEIINGPKEYITLFLFNIIQTFQSSVSQHLWRFVWWQEIGQMTSGALWLAQLCELALQEHSGNTKSLLLVDRLSQDVVVSDTLEARLLTQLGQKLWKQKQRAKWDFRVREQRRRRKVEVFSAVAWNADKYPGCYNVKFNCWLSFVTASFPCCSFCTNCCIIL